MARALHGRPPMWLEAIITREDLVQALEGILPVKIHLQKEGEEDNDDRWLLLNAATSVALVAGEGLRVTCPAELSWTVAGMNPRMNLDELRVLLIPRVGETSKGNVLELHIRVEEADFHVLPEVIDEAIVKSVNAALVARRIAWNFTETLTRTVGLGTMFDPIEALQIAVQWGKLRVTPEGLALAVSFKLGFVRDD